VPAGGALTVAEMRARWAGASWCRRCACRRGQDVCLLPAAAGRWRAGRWRLLRRAVRACGGAGGGGVSGALAARAGLVGTARGQLRRCWLRVRHLRDGLHGCQAWPRCRPPRSSWRSTGRGWAVSWHLHDEQPVRDRSRGAGHAASSSSAAAPARAIGAVEPRGALGPPIIANNANLRAPSRGGRGRHGAGGPPPPRRWRWRGPPTADAAGAGTRRARSHALRKNTSTAPPPSCDLHAHTCPAGEACSVASTRAIAGPPPPRAGPIGPVLSNDPAGRGGLGGGGAWPGRATWPAEKWRPGPPPPPRPHPSRPPPPRPARPPLPGYHRRRPPSPGHPLNICWGFN
jgi:hypothetical protein